MKEFVAVPIHVEFPQGPSFVISKQAATIGDSASAGQGSTCPSTAAAFGAEPVDKSGTKVRGMFAEIAPRYDLVNRLLSGGIDVWWRHVTVRRAPPPAAGAILDVCTGTGDLALAYAAKAGPRVRIVASDFCRPMLDRGVEKSRQTGLPVEWVEADAMELPFPTASFDLVTVAFGLRNIADTARGLAEMARVCRPGGTLAILEFSLPRNRFIRNGYLWYFRRMLPFLGNAVARNRSDAYTYLNKSVEEFPAGEALATLVQAAGFDRVEIVPLTFGIATLYVCHRGA
ncbi:MAG: bifunctional demethylmenaquinone methyltransferase/2-methoxy-6-polyprenyl-1,4-benzoquinol methylase UbiE [Pirellulales bacterium]